MRQRVKSPAGSLAPCWCGWRLDVLLTPVRRRCGRCGQEYRLEGHVWRAQLAGSGMVEVVAS